MPSWAGVVAHTMPGRSASPELTPAVALGTRPVDFGTLRYSAGFMWNERRVAETIHVKSCLSNEDGAWETTGMSAPFPTSRQSNVGGARVGMLIGLELWMTDQARFYGDDGVHIIIVRGWTAPPTRKSNPTNGLDGDTTAAKPALLRFLQSRRQG